MPWDKTSIHMMLDANSTAVVRALRAIAALQTDDELSGHHTRHTNGVGFSKFDAPFLTDMLLQINRGRTLSPKQLAVTRNKIKRYWRQLVEIANASGKPCPTLAVEGQHAPAEVAVESFDASVRKVSAARVDARDAVLKSLDCTCAEHEFYDGEDVCPSCKQRHLSSAYRDVAASW